MRKHKIKMKVAAGLLALVFAFGPVFSFESLAASTIVTIDHTQVNVPVSTIPSISFSGGADAVSSSIASEIRFANGANAMSDGEIPAIAFTSGTDGASASIPDIIFGGGDDETKASRTLTINVLPANNETIIIGNCTVNFVDGAGTGDNSGFTGDLDCADEVATVSNYTRTNPGIARTAEQLATRLRLLVNVSDDAHGALIVSGSGSDIIFTAAGTETVASNIVFTDGTSGKITNPNTATSVVGVAAQTEAVVPIGLVASAADHSVTIDGISIELGTDSQNASGIASMIKEAVNDANTNFSTGTAYKTYPYTVSSIGTALTFTVNSTGSLVNGSVLLGTAVGNSDYTSTNTSPATASFAISYPLKGALYEGVSYIPYDHSVIVDGVSINLADPDNPDDPQTTDQIAATIAAADFSGKDYTASSNESIVTFTKGPGVLGGETLTAQDRNYTSTGPVPASITVTIPDEMPADAPDHLLNIDGTSINLGTSALDQAGIAGVIRDELKKEINGYSGKNYTISGSGADVIFIKKAAGPAGNGLLEDPLGAGVDYNYTIANAVVATAQFTVPVDGTSSLSTDRSITIDSITTDLSAGDLDAETIAGEIAAKNFSSRGYTAEASGADVIFTRTTAGEAGNSMSPLTVQKGNYGAVAQIETITLSNITAGETVTVTINDIDYSYLIKTGDTATEVVSGLQAAIDNADVADSGMDTLILTANVSGNPFTVNDSLGEISIAPAPSGHKHKKKRTYKIYGFVKTQGVMAPISGAIVDVYTEGGTKKCSVKTNASGKYSCKNLKKGKKYIIWTSAAGYHNAIHSSRYETTQVVKITASKKKDIYLSR